MSAAFVSSAIYLYTRSEICKLSLEFHQDLMSFLESLQRKWVDQSLCELNIVTPPECPKTNLMSMRQPHIPIRGRLYGYM